MIHGLDTGFLVAVELLEHVQHTPARSKLGGILSSGDQIGIAPQVLSEFAHIVTDPRRLTNPLDMTAAIAIAKEWWTAPEVVQVFPDAEATEQFLDWIGKYSLGRKRL